MRNYLTTLQNMVKQGNNDIDIDYLVSNAKNNGSGLFESLLNSNFKAAYSSMVDLGIYPTCREPSITWVSPDLKSTVLNTMLKLRAILIQPPIEESEIRWPESYNNVNLGIKKYYLTDNPLNSVAKDWLVRHTMEVPVPILVNQEKMNDFIAELVNHIISKENNSGDLGFRGIGIDLPVQTQQGKEVADKFNADAFLGFHINKALEFGASDIHFEPSASSLVVRYRVDGILVHAPITPWPVNIAKVVVAHIKIRAKMDVVERRRPQDGRLEFAGLNNRQLDLRISTVPTIYGEKVVMRLLHKEILFPSIDHLQLPKDSIAALRDKLQAPQGLILISGPTGSGKTTTLYSCLRHLKYRTMNITTIEDPVEYRLDGIHQIQVNPQIDLTFAKGLRSLLRQDPNVIMVGEIRDEETAGLAVQAAMTGHLVLSTIHTNDAIGIIGRLLNFNVPPYLISAALSQGIAQRLMRKLCMNCREEVYGGELLLKSYWKDISQSKRISMNIHIEENRKYFTYKQKGCNQCRYTGYSGQIPVFELFNVTHQVRQAINARDYDREIVKRIVKEDGMKLMSEIALELIQKGITTHDEMIRNLERTD